MSKLFFKRTALSTGRLVFLLLTAVVFIQTQENKLKETIVAGGPKQFMEVRHVVIKGSNFEVGKQIAGIAIRYGIKLTPGGNPLINKLTREYMAKNYPVYYERMKGVASAFGLPFEDDRYDFSGISQFSLSSPGCSAVFYPGQFTKNGHGLLSRNYDFTTGTILGKFPKPGERPAMSRPYVLEIYPDRGYASLAICTFDMLGGVIDGINSEGLVVAILAEEESIQKFGLEPGNEVGLYELQSMRYLLDNCKDVTEAKEALLSLKHYYSFIPCHYIIADRSGRSFIFEFSPHRNRCLTTDGKGPQCVTNHLVALHPSEADLPAGDSFNRFKTLRVATKIKEKFTLAEIREINARVAIPPLASNNPEYAPGRTIWYALYDTEERSLSIRFYLGEKPDPADPKGVILNYSQLKEFRLKK